MEQNNPKFKAYFYKEMRDKNFSVGCVISENEELLNKEFLYYESLGYKHVKDLSSIPGHGKKIIIRNMRELVKNYKNEIINEEKGQDILISMLNDLTAISDKVYIDYDGRMDLDKGVQLLKDNFSKINFLDKIYVYTRGESKENPPSLALIKEVDDVVSLTVDDIEKKDFSPFEKLIAALAIAEKLVVNDENLVVKHASDAGGNIYEAISRNNILCQGYSNIFELFSNKLGIKTVREDFVSPEFHQAHAVSIVDIADEKYGISGKYLFDVTQPGVYYSYHTNNQDEKAKSFIIYLARYLGVGKDNFDQYEEIYGKDDKLDKIKSIISSRPIPLDIFEKASDYVNSKYVFEVDNSAKTLNPEELAKVCLEDKSMPEEILKARATEEQQHVIKDTEDKGELCNE